VSRQGIGDGLVGPRDDRNPTVRRVCRAASRGDGFDCQGNRDTPFTVELPEPIGDRRLIEGLEIGIDLADYVD
jgi:hypothetical protein